MNARILLAATSLAAAAAAQERPRPGDALEPELPRYHVEVILFAHADANPSEELFGHERVTADAEPEMLEPLRAAQIRRLDPRSLGLPPAEARPLDPGTNVFGEPELRVPAPVDLDPLEDFTREQAPAADPFELIDPFGRGRALTRDSSGFRFRLLGPDELRLGEEFRRMQRLDAYRTLGHVGWVQEGLDAQSSRPMNLAYLGITNPVGTLRLYVSRFLHIDVDLQYQAGRPLRTSAGDSFEAFDLGSLATGQRYEFHMERNAFRSGELQYIDHPMFGILVLVTPAPEEAEVEDDTSVLRPAA